MEDSTCHYKMKVEVAALCKLPNFQKEAENTTTINIRELKNLGNEPSEILASNGDSEEIKEASVSVPNSDHKLKPDRTLNNDQSDSAQKNNLLENKAEIDEKEKIAIQKDLENLEEAPENQISEEGEVEIKEEIMDDAASVDEITIFEKEIYADGHEDTELLEENQEEDK